MNITITGLQDSIVDFKSGSDRSSERYIFDDSSMFDASGRALKDVDCVYFPSLSIKSSIPRLKGFRCGSIICVSYLSYWLFRCMFT